MAKRPIAVLKIGGSVLTGRQAYRRVAAFLGDRLCANPNERLVVVVSAQNGTTDALLATAREIATDPDPSTVDLLWSIGETESAALLALFLQARGVRARAASIHESGLQAPDTSALLQHSEFSIQHCKVRPLRLLSLVAQYDVVVAPGFLARGGGDRVVSLGRGGSDLTAVLLAAGLGAVRCELVKDVPGYFTSDPKRDPAARPLPRVTYDRAIEMADDGCALVQRHALVAARDQQLPLVIRAMASEATTLVTTHS